MSNKSKSPIVMTDKEVIIATTKQAILDTPEYPVKKTLKYINEVARGLGIVNWLIKNRPEFYTRPMNKTKEKALINKGGDSLLSE